MSNLPRAFGRYRLEQEIGRGGRGIVFRAFDTHLHRHVALKIISEVDDGGASATRLLREARAAAAINHPNAAIVHDTGEVDGVAYLAMELIEGRTLRAELTHRPDIPLAERMRWLVEIARALEAAHARGVVHRDVKPENVMVRPDGGLKVLDFGIARRIGGESATRPGVIVGTPCYMSPEQLRGDELDARTDQFAWAVIACEILSGELPWDEGRPGVLARLTNQHAHFSGAWPAELDAVKRVVARALSLDRAERFDSIDTMLEALEKAGVDAAGASANVPPPPPRLAEATLTAPSSDEDSGVMPAGGIAELPPLVAGRYRPIRLIGRGSVGAVYEVEHVNTGERWAMKLLHRSHAFDAARADRFRQEARVSARVKSEHIVRVVDAGEEEMSGAPYLVMELLEGRDLERESGDRKQSPADVADWIGQAARGLAKAHAAGIVHRDLKPENLFLAHRADEAPIIKILDFGIAKVRGVREEQPTLEGVVLGTPRYMPPEQVPATWGSRRGDAEKLAEPTPANDVWALGMVAFRLLAGRPYWATERMEAVFAELGGDSIGAPSERGLDLGEAFDAWFRKSCASDPEQRFGSVTEQASELAKALVVTRETPAEVTSEKPRSRRAATGFAVASVVAIGAVIIVRVVTPAPVVAIPERAAPSAPKEEPAATIDAAAPSASVSAPAIEAASAHAPRVAAPLRSSATAGPAIAVAPSAAVPQPSAAEPRPSSSTIQGGVFERPPF